MSWATPEERRNLGRARRKQLGRQQNDQLNIIGRRAAPLALLDRAERPACHPYSSSSISSWHSRRLSFSAEGSPGQKRLAGVPPLRQS